MEQIRKQKQDRLYGELLKFHRAADLASYDALLEGDLSAAPSNDIPNDYPERLHGLIVGFINQPGGDCQECGEYHPPVVDAVVYCYELDGSVIFPQERFAFATPALGCDPDQLGRAVDPVKDLEGVGLTFSYEIELDDARKRYFVPIGASVWPSERARTLCLDAMPRDARP